jgi:hypothetical protein
LHGHRAVYGELFTQWLRATGIGDRTLTTAATTLTGTPPQWLREIRKAPGINKRAGKSPL